MTHLIEVLGSIVVSVLNIVAAVYVVSLRMKRTESTIKKQITNNHKIHLRDDLDGKHEELLRRQDEVMGKLSEINDRVHLLDSRFSSYKDFSMRNISKLWSVVRKMK